MAKLISTIVCSLILAFHISAQENRIVVTGSAKIFVAPDVAHFNLLIEQHNFSVQKAKIVVDDKVARVTKLLEQSGIEQTTIDNSSYNIHPQYKYNENNKFTGFLVSRNIKFKLNDLTQLFVIIDGVVKRGVTRIVNQSVTIESPEKFYLKVLGLALDNAKDKAVILAKNAKLNLGDIVSIEEFSNRGANVISQSAAYRVSESSQVANRGLSATVKVIFELNKN